MELQIAQLLFVVTSVVSTRVGRNDDGVCGTLASVLGVFTVLSGVVVNAHGRAARSS